ncbi:hypothetical protein H6F67_15790 [Microcoleus sp. FACHB-1515]|uniref:hypothetical protein n=1 Tax=Cyanophyceae TaxID=3028117 RepID=UPI0016867B65|nr:hypothetical protein [Microcoleus sp. FACHB-1515]MBD2091308.1 hypothetical protein [Microcoleus sp. FACHB-1515]
MSGTVLVALLMKLTMLTPLPLMLKGDTAVSVSTGTDPASVAQVSSPPQVLRPPQPSFGSDRLDQQIWLYEQYLQTQGRPDVLIVGSSRSLQGIDPAALEQALIQRGHAPLRIYNFSINGATARVVDLVLTRILTADQLPRLIIWGDGLRAFNSGRPDLTYRSIAASEGYRSLARGDRPIQASATPSAENCQTVSSVQLCLGQANLYLPEVNAFSVATNLQPNGFEPIATRFDPASYYRSRSRVPGRYDSSYVPFNLNGEQIAATVQVARFARSQQIPLVVVNLPLTRDYLDAARQNFEQQFRQRMQTLAAREGFVFRDYSLRWPTQTGNFADPSHLNQAGAIAVARDLAADPTIPWPRDRF